MSISIHPFVCIDGAIYRHLRQQMESSIKPATDTS